MSESKNEQAVNDELIDVSHEIVEEPDPFASLNKMLEENPVFKGIFDSVKNILGDESAEDESEEFECYEIDGRDYIVCKEIEIVGKTYLYLVNEDNVMDFMIQKVIVEDGKEFITNLDSEKEFDLVYAYFKRDSMMQLKAKLKSDIADKPDNQ